jgi:hypothetical protein
MKKLAEMIEEAPDVRSLVILREVADKEAASIAPLTLIDEIREDFEPEFKRLCALSKRATERLKEFEEAGDGRRRD